MTSYPPGSIQLRRAARPEEQPFSSRFGKTMLVLGSAVMVAGIYGLFLDADRTRPADWFRWFTGVLVAHDGIVAPVTFLIALAVSRIPSRHRRFVQGALVASGIVVLTTFPFLRGYGRKADNPTVLPNDYASGLATVLALIWILAAALAVRSAARAATPEESGPP